MKSINTLTTNLIKYYLIKRDLHVQEKVVKVH